MKHERVQQIWQKFISNNLSESIWKVQGLGLLALIYSNFFPRLFHLGEYLFFILLFLTIGISVIERNETHWVRTPLDLSIATLLLWILLTVPFAFDPSYSFTEWRKLAGRFLVFYWTLVVLRHQSEPNFSTRALGVLVFSGSIVAIQALIYFIQYDGSLVNRGIRARASSGDHSHWMAIYMTIVIPAAAYLYRIVQIRWMKIFLAGCLGLTIMTLFLTYSRGGWVAFGLQALFYAAVHGGRWRLIFAVGGIILFAVFAFGLSQGDYLAGIFDMESVRDRLGCWDLGMREVVQNPFFGVGFGNDTFVKMYPGDPPGDCTGGHLHNTFFTYLMGSGFFAFLLLIWVLGSMVWVQVRSKIHQADIYTNRLAETLAIVAVGFSACMLFNYTFTGSLAYVFMILMAIGIGNVLAHNRQPISKSTD